MRLITEVYPEAKVKGTTFSFNVAWPNTHSRSYGMKDIGQTTIGTKGPDDTATLKSKNFVIGDYLDVAINVARGRDNREKNNRNNDNRRQNYRDYR